MNIPAAVLPSALAPAATALPDAALAHAIADLLQRPLAHRHPSWLPADWPPPLRRADRFGNAGAGVLAAPLSVAVDAAAQEQLLTLLAGTDRLPRVVLMERSALRLLAIWVGLAVHKAGFAIERRMVPAQLAESIEPLASRLAGATPRAMRRAARRIDAQAVAFLLKRVPDLGDVPMNLAPMRARPACAARLMAERGYRLLGGLLEAYGAPLLRVWRFKSPRRLAMLPPAELSRSQAAQLRELVLLNLIPERFPAWHWLF